MPKTNYRFAKNQRELAKKRRQMQKQQRHADRAAARTAVTDESATAPPDTRPGDVSEP